MADLFRILDDDDGPARVVELALPSFLDDADFDRLSTDLMAAVSASAGDPWVLDLRATDYMGSAMLGLLVNVRQVIKQSDGLLVLCNVSDRLHSILNVTSMSRLFTITRTRADALAWVGERY